MNSTVGAISTEPVWCSASPLLGSAVKFGSSPSARLIFTTPLRVFHRSMSVTNAGGQFAARYLVEEGDLRVQRGHDERRVHLVAIGEHGPADPSAAHDQPVDASVSADLGTELAADAAIAADTAPMPPSG